MGFDVTNDLFANHSWYFRNALVRANYQNVQKGVMRNSEYLERFFRNLLLGENNELRNRYMVVNVPEEPAGEQMQQVDRTSNRTSSCHIACLVQRAVISEKSDGEDRVETQAYIFRKLHGSCLGSRYCQSTVPG